VFCLIEKKMPRSALIACDMYNICVHSKRKERVRDVSVYVREKKGNNFHSIYLFFFFSFKKDASSPTYFHSSWIFFLKFRNFYKQVHKSSNENDFRVFLWRMMKKFSLQVLILNFCVVATSVVIKFFKNSKYLYNFFFKGGSCKKKL
jgi:hypothetical protein